MDTGAQPDQRPPEPQHDIASRAGIKMPENNQPKNNTAKGQEYQELVRKIADRVWEMWRRDMRLNQERKLPGRRR